MAQDTPLEAAADARDAPTGPDAAQAPEPTAPTPSPSPGSYADGRGAWWVPTWYVLLCAMPLAGAFFLPVPLMMVMRSTRPPYTFMVAGWTGIALGWALWLFAVLAWLVGGWLFSGHGREITEMATWWRRTTQMWILLVLAWGAVATIGIWIFYALLGQTVGLTDAA